MPGQSEKTQPDALIRCASNSNAFAFYEMILPYFNRLQRLFTVMLHSCITIYAIFQCFRGCIMFRVVGDFRPLRANFPLEIQICDAGKRKNCTGREKNVRLTACIQVYQSSGSA